jgi:hypothetical protein
MQRFVAFQHANELLNTLRARLGFLGGLNSEQHHSYKYSKENGALDWPGCAAPHLIYSMPLRAQDVTLGVFVAEYSGAAPPDERGRDCWRRWPIALGCGSRARACGGGSSR